MRIVNSVLCGFFPVCVIFVPLTLLSCPQNSKESLCANLKPVNELEWRDPLSSYRETFSRLQK